MKTVSSLWASLAVAAIGCVLISQEAARSESFFVVNEGIYTHTYAFGTFDVSSEVFSQKSILPYGTDALGFSTDGTLYAASGHDLYTINPTTGASALRSSSLANATVGLAPGSDANHLIGVNVYGQLMTIDTNSGLETPYGLATSSFPYSAVSGSLSYGPGGDLYFVDQYSLYSRDVSTGAATNLGYIGSPYHGVYGLVYADGHLDSFETGNYSGQVIIDYASPGGTRGYYYTTQQLLLAAAFDNGGGGGPSGPDTPEPGPLAFFGGAAITSAGMLKRRRKRTCHS